MTMTMTIYIYACVHAYVPPDFFSRQPPVGGNSDDDACAIVFARGERNN